MHINSFVALHPGDPAFPVGRIKNPWQYANIPNNTGYLGTWVGRMQSTPYWSDSICLGEGLVSQCYPGVLDAHRITLRDTET